MDFVNWLRLQWDRFGALTCVVVSVVLLIVGYLGVSDTAFTAEQMPYVISGGLGGLFLLGIGSVLWLSADLRDEWRKLDRIEELLASRMGGEEPSAPAARTGELDDDTREMPVTATRTPGLPYPEQGQR